MTIRPVEFHSSLPKLTEIGRLEQAKEMQWQMKNQQFAAELQQQALNRQKQVTDPEKSEKAQADADNSDPGKKQREGRQKRKTNPPSADKAAADGIGAHLDIRT